jgi:toxin ParE1/3/4
VPLDYSLANEAIFDLGSIWHHYAEHASLRVADEVLQRIHATVVRTIAQRPRAGRLRLELGDLIYSYPVIPYVVFYEVDGRRVRILRILHGHRDIHEPLMSLLAVGKTAMYRACFVTSVR